jgi:hypothetical protein
MKPGRAKASETFWRSPNDETRMTIEVRIAEDDPFGIRVLPLLIRHSGFGLRVWDTTGK